MTELIESLPFELPTIELLIFIATAAVAIAAAVMVVFQRNAMYSALFLVANFFCLAVMYLLLGAYFLAVVQIAVYAGAIMVLMLFVIMLLNVARPEPTGTRLAGLKLFGGVVAFILLAQITLVAVRSSDVLPEPPPPGHCRAYLPALRSRPKAVGGSDRAGRSGLDDYAHAGWDWSGRCGCGTGHGRLGGAGL